MWLKSGTFLDSTGGGGGGVVFNKVGESGGVKGQWGVSIWRPENGIFFRLTVKRSSDVIDVIVMLMNL